MSTGMLNDPLVPLDFGGYFTRVFGVIKRDWRRLTAVAAVPAAVYLMESLAIAAVMPNPDEMRQIATDAARAAAGEPSTAGIMWAIFGPVLPVALVFTVLLAVSLAFFVGTVFFLAVSRANGQPGTVAQALAYARPRVLPLIGWTVLLYLVTTLLLAGVLVPAFLPGSGWVMGLGVVFTVPLAFVLHAMFVAAVVGVVVIERAGPGRAIGLLRGRFWPTCGRMFVAGLLYMAWGALMAIATAPLSSGEDLSLTLGSAFGAIIYAVLLVPVMLYSVSVCLVSYAELRHREDRTVTTSTIAAQLGARSTAPAEPFGAG